MAVRSLLGQVIFLLDLHGMFITLSKLPLVADHYLSFTRRYKFSLCPLHACVLFTSFILFQSEDKDKKKKKSQMVTSKSATSIVKYIF